ncbi:hypothetical protein RI367_000152 [Sorochytrium milnesiophthora]
MTNSRRGRHLDLDAEYSDEQLFPGYARRSSMLPGPTYLQQVEEQYAESAEGYLSSSSIDDVIDDGEAELEQAPLQLDNSHAISCPLLGTRHAKSSSGDRRRERAVSHFGLLEQAARRDTITESSSSDVGNSSAADVCPVDDIDNESSIANDNEPPVFLSPPLSASALREAPAGHAKSPLRNPSPPKPKQEQEELTPAMARLQKERDLAARALKAIKKGKAHRTPLPARGNDQPESAADIHARKVALREAMQEVYREKLQQKEQQAQFQERQRAALKRLSDSVRDIRQDIVVTSGIAQPRDSIANLSLSSSSGSQLEGSLRSRTLGAEATRQRSRRWHESMQKQAKVKQVQQSKREQIRQRLLVEEARIRRKQEKETAKAQPPTRRPPAKSSAKPLMEPSPSSFAPASDGEATHVAAKPQQQPLDPRYPDVGSLPFLPALNEPTSVTAATAAKPHQYQPRTQLSTALPAFVPSPRVLAFRSVLPGRSYRQDLVLTNTSNHMSSIKFVEVQNDVDMLLDVRLPAPGPISAGLACKTRVTADLPADWMPTDKDLQLVFDCEHGGRLVVPVQIVQAVFQPYLKRTKYCKSLPAGAEQDMYAVDFGSCESGASVSRRLKLVNDGTTAYTYRATLDSMPGEGGDAWVFTPSDPTGILAARSTMDISLAFCAVAAAPTQRQFTIRFDEAGNAPRPIVCRLTAAISTSPVQLNTDALDLGMCIVGECYRDNVVLHNTSASPVSFSLTFDTQPSSSPGVVEKQDRPTSGLEAVWPGFGEVEISPATGTVQPGEHVQLWFKLRPSRNAWLQRNKAEPDDDSGAPAFSIGVKLQTADKTRCLAVVKLRGTFTDVSLKVASSTDIKLGQVTVGECCAVPLELVNHSHLPQHICFDAHVSNTLCTVLEDPVGTLVVSPVLDDGTLRMRPRQRLVLQLLFTPAMAGSYQATMTCLTAFGKRATVTCHATVQQPFAMFSRNSVDLGRVSLGSKASARLSIDAVYSQKEMLRRQQKHVDPSEYEQGTFEFGQPEAWTTATDTTHPDQAPAAFRRVDWRPEDGDMPLKIYPLSGRINWAESRKIDVHFSLVDTSSWTLNNVATADHHPADDSLSPASRRVSAKVPKVERPRSSASPSKLGAVTEQQASQPNPSAGGAEEVAARVERGPLVQEGKAFLFRVPCRVRMLRRCKRAQTKALQLEAYYPNETVIVLQVSACVAPPAFAVLLNQTPLSHLAFGDVPVGERHAQMLTLRNQSSDDLCVSVVSESPFSPFYTAGKPNTMPRDSTCTLAVVYEPTAQSGSKDFDFIDLATSGTQVRLKVEGSSYVPAVSTEPDTLSFDFGDVILGETSTRSFKVRNGAEIPAQCALLQMQPHRPSSKDHRPHRSFLSQSRVQELLDQTCSGARTAEGTLPFTISGPPDPVPAKGEHDMTVTFEGNVESADCWVDDLLVCWGVPPHPIHARGRCHRFSVFVSGYPFRKLTAPAVFPEGEGEAPALFELISLEYTWVQVSQQQAAEISEDVAAESEWHYYKLEHDPIEVHHAKAEAKKGMQAGYDIKRLDLPAPVDLSDAAHKVVSKSEELLALITETLPTDKPAEPAVPTVTTVAPSEPSGSLRPPSATTTTTTTTEAPAATVTSSEPGPPVAASRASVAASKPSLAPSRPASSATRRSSVAVSSRPITASTVSVKGATTLLPAVPDQPVDLTPKLQALPEQAAIEMGKSCPVYFEVVNLPRVVSALAKQRSAAASAAPSKGGAGADKQHKKGKDNAAAAPPAASNKHADHGDGNQQQSRGSVIYRVAKDQAPPAITAVFDISCTGGIDLRTKKPTTDDLKRIYRVQVSPQSTSKKTA